LGDKQVNTFVFPCLASGNIASMFIQQLGGFEGIGPIMLGLKKPVHLIPSESSVRELVNMAAVAAGEAQTLKE
jgi:malate dehydrogenase (oxaloacetate-decarboxylating)(NADP+)